MCRAWEGSKIKVFKNAYWNIWTRNQYAMVKYEHNIGFENLDFSFLPWACTKKLIDFTFWLVFYNYLQVFIEIVGISVVHIESCHGFDRHWNWSGQYTSLNQFSKADNRLKGIGLQASRFPGWKLNRRLSATTLNMVRLVSPRHRRRRREWCHAIAAAASGATPSPPPRVVPRRAPLPSAASSCEHDTFTVYIESQFVRSVSPSLP